MRIAILGSHGLVGEAMTRTMDNVVLALSREVCDVTDTSKLISLLRREKIDVVMNCAAKVGGIQLNRMEPYTMYQANSQIGYSVLQACLQSDVTDLVQLCSSCAYPADAIQPYKESELLMGEPVKSNKGYAAAKIASLHAGQAAEDQFGLRVYHPIICSLFGLADNFNPNDSHFVPAVIRKIKEAVDQSLDTITFWGTGKPRREYLFADELSSAINMMLERRYSYLPLNIGPGVDVPISDIISTISCHAGFKGHILWDETKPDGALKKLLDSSLVKSWGWLPAEPLVDTLCKTYDYFKSSSNVRK
jgi:GDP-L-fucose synthase